MTVNRIVTAAVAALAGCGVLGMAPAAAQASSAPTWTKQAPATSPPARDLASMAYDAATSDIVLFGGNKKHGKLGDTWTWGG